jgi:hypothetical protein
MKAAVLHHFGDIPRYEDFPEPTPGVVCRNTFRFSDSYNFPLACWREASDAS